MRFFKVRSVAEIFDMIRGFPRLPEERVPLDQADGRVLSREVISPEDLPQTSRSAMDGFAVAAADTFGASEGQPAYLRCVARLHINDTPQVILNPGDCAGIVTGGVLPQGADAVIMVEYTQELDQETIEVRRSVAPGENVLLRAEDVALGEVALPAGRALRPQEIGLLAALGVLEISAVRRPRVGILSTGDELIPCNQAVLPGLVRDVNSHSLAAWVARMGCQTTLLGIVRDDLASLRTALELGLAEHDAVLISGGSSVGARDHTLGAIESLQDSEILAHGVAMSPGKPTILARIGDKVIWGLPGQVTSAQVVAHILVQPCLRHIMGETGALDQERRPRYQAMLSKNIASRQGREDYVRVRLGQSERGSGPLAAPVLGKSGLLRTLLDAQGLVRVPADIEGLEAGTLVDVFPLE